MTDFDLDLYTRQRISQLIKVSNRYPLKEINSIQFYKKHGKEGVDNIKEEIYNIEELQRELNDLRKAAGLSIISKMRLN